MGSSSSRNSVEARGTVGTAKDSKPKVLVAQSKHEPVFVKRSAPRHNLVESKHFSVAVPSSLDILHPAGIVVDRAKRVDEA